MAEDQVPYSHEILHAMLLSPRPNRIGSGALQGPVDSQPLIHLSWISSSLNRSLSASTSRWYAV